MPGLHNAVFSVLAVTCTVSAQTSAPIPEMRMFPEPGRQVEYAFTQSCDCLFPDGFRIEGDLALTLRVIGMPNGWALLDVELKELEIKKNGKKRPHDPVARFNLRVRGLGHHLLGLDPFKAMARPHRKLLMQLYPIPTRDEVAARGWKVSYSYFPNLSKFQTQSVTMEKVSASKARIAIAGANDKGRGALRGQVLWDGKKGLLAKYNLKGKVEVPLSGSFEARLSIKKHRALRPAELRETKHRFNGRLAIHRALAMANAKRVDEALKLLSVAAEQAPACEHARYHLAILYLAQRRYEHAADAIERELKANPGFVPSMKLGLKIHRMQKNEGKVEALKKALEELTGRPH